MFHGLWAMAFSGFGFPLKGGQVIFHSTLECFRPVLNIPFSDWSYWEVRAHLKGRWWHTGLWGNSLEWILRHKTVHCPAERQSVLHQHMPPLRCAALTKCIKVMTVTEYRLEFQYSKKINFSLYLLVILDICWSSKELSNTALKSSVWLCFHWPTSIFKMVLQAAVLFAFLPVVNYCMGFF